MTVELIARQLDLWEDICRALEQCSVSSGRPFIRRLAILPVRSSRATRSLGSFVLRDNQPVCIRLQFAQEPESLRQTLLHEIAHACDHFSRPGRRLTHGPSWQVWAKLLGTSTERLGHSERLGQLYQRRSKPVAVCLRCGTEIKRVRRLNRRQQYRHRSCGGRLRPL